MANQLARIPWTIDTTSDTPVFTGFMNIIRISFTDYTDASHSVEVKDGFGNLVCKLDGNIEMEEIESYFSGWIQGLTVPTGQGAGGLVTNMQSGKLLIQLA